MPRVCEICGTVDAEKDETAEPTNAIEMLCVCDRCREEREEENGL